MWALWDRSPTLLYLGMHARRIRQERKREVELELELKFSGVCLVSGGLKSELRRAPRLGDDIRLQRMAQRCSRILVSPSHTALSASVFNTNIRLFTCFMQYLLPSLLVTIARRPFTTANVGTCLKPLACKWSSCRSGLFANAEFLLRCPSYLPWLMVTTWRLAIVAGRNAGTSSRTSSE